MTRAPAMAEMDRAAAAGQLALQHCADCAAAQYPPRELCRVCLSPNLEWRHLPWTHGTVRAIASVQHSHDPAMRATLPRRIGIVQLDSGPSAVCDVPNAQPDARVSVTARTDPSGRAILTAAPLE